VKEAVKSLTEDSTNAALSWNEFKESYLNDIDEKNANAEGRVRFAFYSS
jgi:hypothetical protein